MIEDIREWSMLLEDSSSDHRYMRFYVGGSSQVKIPRATDWKVYKEEMDRITERLPESFGNQAELNAANDKMVDIVMEAWRNSTEVKEARNKMNPGGVGSSEHYRRGLRIS